MFIEQANIHSWNTSWRIDLMTHRTMSERSYHRAMSHSWNSSMGHHEWSIRRPIAPWANALTMELRLAPSFPNASLTSRSWNSSMGPLHEWSIQRPIAPWANTLTTELCLTPEIAQWVHHEGSIRRPIAPQSYVSLLQEIAQWAHPMKDQSNDPSHHRATCRSWNSSWRIDPTTHRTTELRLAPTFPDAWLTFDTDEVARRVAVGGLQHILAALGWEDVARSVGARRNLHSGDYEVLVAVGDRYSLTGKDTNKLPSLVLRGDARYVELFYWNIYIYIKLMKAMSKTAG